MNAQNRTIGWFIGAAGMVILTGCVVEGGSNVRVVSDRGCTPGTIYDVGFEDGTQGFPRNKAGDFRRCSPNLRQRALEAYHSGWDAGIEQYCSEGNGFVVGANGIPNAQTCPGSLAKSFRRGHLVGADVFKENQSIAAGSERLQILDRNIQSGRFTPAQLETLLKDRRKVLKGLRKDERQRDRQLERANRRGYPVL